MIAYLLPSVVQKQTKMSKSPCFHGSSFPLWKSKWGWLVASFSSCSKIPWSCITGILLLSKHTMNREAGSWKPIIILFSTPRGRAAPESCRETFQHCTSWELTAVARICFYGNRRLNSSSDSGYAEGSYRINFYQEAGFIFL